MEIFAIVLAVILIGLVWVFWPQRRGSYEATFRPDGHRLTMRGYGKEKAKRYAKSYMRANEFEGFTLRRI